MDTLTPPTTPTTTPTSTTTKPKKERKWQTEFKWVQHLTEQEADLGYCSWVRDAKKSNALANGTSVYRDQHGSDQSHPEHKLVSIARQPQKQQPTQEHTTNNRSSHPCNEAQLRTMYFIMKINLPIHMHIHYYCFIDSNRCPDLQELANFYSSHGSQTDIKFSINQAVEDSILTDIRLPQADWYHSR